MQLHRFDSIYEFWDHAHDYLLQHQAEHNLLLALSHSLLQDPDRYPELPYLAIAKHNSTILAVAIRTPPYKLVLSKAQDLNALALIAQDVQNELKLPPGVSGLVPEVEMFLPVWNALTGQSYRRAVEMRIHQLTQVHPIAAVRGHLRLATEVDRPLLLDWFTAFAAEIGDMIRQDAEQAISSGLKRQSIYVWDDGIPVSWANRNQFLPTAARIGPVYTPPEHRRKGYATACVAALSQTLLDQGCDRCFLFTDLANSTSNHIYREIGYQPVCNWHDYSFQAQESP